MRPGRSKRVLVIISSVNLDNGCGDVLTIRKTGEMMKKKIKSLSDSAAIGNTAKAAFVASSALPDRGSSKSGVVFETCQAHHEPVIFTGHSRNLWVDFVAGGNHSGRGFQISFLTIDGKRREGKFPSAANFNFA